ncbi:DNA polymerase I, partial [Thermococci archaeon]
IKLSISRNGRFRKLESKSYFSYGRMLYRPSAYIPAGRILIDTVNSFNYSEGGLKGILLASRLACIPPNYAARFTPGTLISSYEVYEALKMGIAVPFRKRDAENTRTLEELKLVDRGGMIFQPEPGVYEKVFQLDFTSMYPAIIVKYNLSPESPNGRKGFLPKVLEPLLNMRIETKRKKKENPEYKGLDSVLKWMLVTCFGYTGYRNAKFGRVEVHESINRIGREILLKAKEIAESMGFEVLHGIVDCLWLRGNDIKALKEKVERETGLLTDIENYSWIVFLPMSDGSGAYNRYYGRLTDGKLKLRGVIARRSDMPEYIRKMQLELFEELSGAESVREISALKDRLLEIYRSYRNRLKKGEVNPRLLSIRRRISKLGYSRKCPELNAIKAYRNSGIRLSPGMDVSFVIRDARRWIVDPPWRASGYDENYYLKLIDKAWKEISFALKCSAQGS